MTEAQKKFIQDVSNYVLKFASFYGIKCHSAIIAQAILESGWGTSTLASKYHNYFGMKCGSKWTGKSVNLTTQEEYTAGVTTTIKDNFRVYDSMEDGVKGYFEFIQLARYQNLKGITDPEIYLQTIKNDGYATSSAYVKNTMKCVTAYNLMQYDKKEGDNMGKYASTIIAIAQGWIGCKESDGSHRKIIDVYNAHKPLPRNYKVTYTDAWCATFVSACAIKAGMTDIIPVECSCNYMIQGFKKLGRWCENDAYRPSAGDIIFYDWQDSGAGDNTGSSDHVGIVEKVEGNTITVIEGNKNDACGRRVISVNGRYIRGYGLPKYDTPSASVTPSTPTPAPHAGYGYYVVKKGDTLSKIASMYGTTYQQLAKDNGIADPNKISVGQSIRIPLDKHSLPASSKTKFTVSGTGSPSRTAVFSATVTASALNVRTWAGAQNTKCSFSPLAKGAVVQVCDSILATDGSTWYYIKSGNKYGFVHSGYISA